MNSRNGLSLDHLGIGTGILHGREHTAHSYTLHRDWRELSNYLVDQTPCSSQNLCCDGFGSGISHDQQQLVEHAQCFRDVGPLTNHHFAWAFVGDIPKVLRPPQCKPLKLKLPELGSKDRDASDRRFGGRAGRPR